GGTGVIAHARWRLLSLTPGRRDGLRVEVKGTLKVTPLDATGVKEIGNVLYTLEDSAGHQWYGTWLGDAEPKRPGRPIERPFSVPIHASAVGSVRLVLEWVERDRSSVPTTRHLLRFAR
ncbi:MAG TPA: hypothetical protein VIR33_12810, partial [Thermopolyspora sp.]